jgi:uncharacterized membrane protein
LAAAVHAAEGRGAAAALTTLRSVDFTLPPVRNAAMRTTLLVLGILALLMGLLWIGQGTGTINWPQSSFMIKQTQWAYYGAALAIVGLILIWRAKR